MSVKARNMKLHKAKNIHLNIIFNTDDNINILL